MIVADCHFWADLKSLANTVWPRKNYLRVVFWSGLELSHVGCSWTWSSLVSSKCRKFPYSHLSQQPVLQQDGVLLRCFVSCTGNVLESVVHMLLPHFFHPSLVQAMGWHLIGCSSHLCTVLANQVAQGHSRTWMQVVHTISWQAGFCSDLLFLHSLHQLVWSTPSCYSWPGFFGDQNLVNAEPNQKPSWLPQHAHSCSEFQSACHWLSQPSLWI